MIKKLEMKENTSAGKLITFCGLDGCGKSTMIAHLAEDLGSRGHRIFITKQPTDSVRNSKIFRTYTDNPNHEEYDYRSLSLLCASDRVQHVNKVIIPALNAGYTVFCDRYYYSCLANLIARGFTDDEWIYEISRCVVKPDAAFFFDVPVDEAVRRVRERPKERDRYIDMQLQHALRKAYIDICNANGGALVKTDTSVIASYKKVKETVERIFDNE